MRGLRLSFLLIGVFYLLELKAQELPEMVEVPGGEFWMGVRQGGVQAEEQSMHKVLLHRFAIARTETTVGQWRLYCAEAGRKMPSPPSWGWVDSLPMVNISWTEAVDYTDWLSEKTGRLYRLPTEAEWTYAASWSKTG